MFNFFLFIIFIFLAAKFVSLQVLIALGEVRVWDSWPSFPVTDYSRVLKTKLSKFSPLIPQIWLQMKVQIAQTFLRYTEFRLPWFNIYWRTRHNLSRSSCSPLEPSKIQPFLSLYRTTAFPIIKNKIWGKSPLGIVRGTAEVSGSPSPAHSCKERGSAKERWRLCSPR